MKAVLVLSVVFVTELHVLGMLLLDTIAIFAFEEVCVGIRSRFFANVSQKHDSICDPRDGSRCICLETRLNDVLKRIFRTFYNECVSQYTIGVLGMLILEVLE